MNRLVKRIAVVATVLAGLAGATVITAASAEAHDHGWKRWKHHHHNHGWDGPPPRYVRAPPVVYERPVYYRDVPAYGYPAYPPGPPSLNLNIPLR